MRAAGITTLGASVELPDPRPPGDDELLIRVRAAGVANWVYIVRRVTGTSAAPRRAAPLALGVGVAGEVVTGGVGSQFAAGDAVMAHPLPLRDQGAGPRDPAAGKVVRARGRRGHGEDVGRARGPCRSASVHDGRRAQR